MGFLERAKNHLEKEPTQTQDTPASEQPSEQKNTSSQSDQQKKEPSKDASQKQEQVKKAQPDKNKQESSPSKNSSTKQSQEETKSQPSPQPTKQEPKSPALDHAKEELSSSGNVEQKPKHPRVIEDSDSVAIEDQKIKELLLSLPSGNAIETDADAFVLYVQEQKKATYAQIQSALNISASRVEFLAKVLSKRKVIDVHFPLVFFASPQVTFLDLPKEEKKEFSLHKDKKELERYTVFTDYVVADIIIWSVPFENTPIYQIVPHYVSPATEVVLHEIIDELSMEIDLDESVVSDPRKVLVYKKKSFERAKALVERYFSSTSPEILHVLAGTVLHRTFGLGDMEIVMSDNWLEEIAINGDTEPMSVYHKRYGWVKTTKYFSKESEIYNFASMIGRKVGKQITALNPIMDAHLQTGDRVAATLFPISTEGDTMTIRRFSRNPWTVVHMVDEKNHTMSKEMMALLWTAIQYELNVLVVGGTASGKTSVLNTMASLIPPTNRIISIEDTREISLPSALHWNWVPLSSKSANAEGEGEVSMLDLMIASLRMRPDRIIVGEIRRKQQAEAMFEAMHTGHSVCATMHADTAEQVKHRLTQPPIDIPENELQALQLVMVQYRDRRKGVRRTLELAELLPGSAEEKINLNYLYRWRARSDTFSKDEASVRVVEDLNLHTGMTQLEIDDELAQKESVLQWLLDNKIFDMDKIGHILRIYYKYPQLLLDTIQDEGSSESLLKGGGLHEG
ncbi:MAG: ATPase, T2SS/T4P/T4SS family [Candidatus Woesearchaeota archaeon]